MHHGIKLLIEIWIGVGIAVPIAFLTAQFASYLDNVFQFGSYLWKVRYCIAKRYAKRVSGMTHYLSRSLLKAKRASYHDQPEIMSYAYQQLASQELMFTRWICKVCLAGYLSVYSCIFFTLFIIYGLPIGLPFATVFVCVFSIFILTHFFIKGTN